MCDIVSRTCVDQCQSELERETVHFSLLKIVCWFFFLTLNLVVSVFARKIKFNQRQKDNFLFSAINILFKSKQNKEKLRFEYLQIVPHENNCVFGDLCIFEDFHDIFATSVTRSSMLI